MSDLLKKGFFLGLGAAISGKEKLSHKLDELVQKGEVSPGQAKEILQGFLEKGESKNKEWSQHSKNYFHQSLQELGFVTKQEYDLLAERVKRLEQKQGEE